MTTYIKLLQKEFRQFVLALVILGCTQLTMAHAINDKLDGNKGLFAVQFSWNSDSYSRKVTVEVEYRKEGFLKKTKVSGQTAFHAIKNQFITLELSDGEYELMAVRLMGPEIGYNKYLKIPMDGKFTIKSGQVTNGGLIYLIRENRESDKVMALRIDNAEDVKRYVRTYKSDYADAGESIVPAWKFLENDKVDKLVESFAKVLVDRHSAKLDTKITHLYATLGTVIKMEKDAQGKVTDYELISTPTYQQIKKMVLKKDHTIICTLENGSFLYGTEGGLDYMPLPKGLEKVPDLEVLKNNRFLLVDGNFNIFSSDTSFVWKVQTDHRYEQKSAGLLGTITISYPKVYKGKRHIYIYSPKDDKHRILLQSTYEDLDFKAIPLSKDVKKVPMVTETPTHIIIGPHLKLSATANRPGYLYVKEHDSDTWMVRDLPRGDCKRFYPGKDESIWYTECSKNNWFETGNAGLSWSKWESKSSK
ncbi:hypothetical protein [Poritiphilus flavus]|uniref:Uncharacterized protein n=1 Tax=Poritiphilus flavus TaxID=2697053 RepID=A0A6L9ECM6_9FLAO|nr:hypothetical protein [Poritiphilus flavus]NAS12149.1 hypothetical protein [Poritiphilus flavus]